MSDGSSLPSIEDAHQFGNPLPAPTVAVVLVVWDPQAGLDRCLAGLARSTRRDFQLVVVGNGVDVIDQVAAAAQWMSGTVITLADNRGPSYARNLAAKQARGRLVLFLDDDAIPDPEWVGAHVEAHEASEVSAVRGLVLADRKRFLTRLARGYDLGDQPRMAVLNTEGNASVDRKIFLELGGFNPAMFGHEGVELTARIVERYGPDTVRYDPAPIIHHDYVSSFSGYLAKRFRHGRMLRRLGLSQMRMAATIRRKRTPWDVVMAPFRTVGLAAELVGFLWPAMSKAAKC